MSVVKYMPASYEANGQRMLNRPASVDSVGRPLSNGVETVRGGDGRLLSQYQISAGEDVRADRTALNMMRSQATGTMPSAWANMQLAANQTAQQGMMDSSARQGATATSQAANQMAASGGVSQAQRMRLAQQGQRNQLMSSQNVRRQGQLDNQNVLAQDAQMKQNMLGQVQGLENAYAGQQMDNRRLNIGVQQQNVGNMLGDVGRISAYDQGNFGEQMKGWAAEQQSNAMARGAGGSGGGGGLLGMTSAGGIPMPTVNAGGGKSVVMSPIGPIPKFW